MEQSSVIPDRTIDTVRKLYSRFATREALEFIIYIVALFGVSVMLWTSRNYQWDDRFFSLLVGVPIIVLLLIQLLFLLRPQLKARLVPQSESESFQEKFSSSVEESSSGRTGAERHKYELYLILWISAFPIGMYFFGMFLVFPLYVFGFLWFFHGNVKLAILLSLISTILAYVIFVSFLDIQVWPGVFFA